jgi:peroxiredoxin
LADYSQAYQFFKDAGAEVAVLSVDVCDRSAAMRAKMGFRFPILCDPSRKVVRAYGIFDPDEAGGISTPATFILDRDLRVQLSAVDDDYNRTSVDQVLEFVQALHEGREPERMPTRTRRFPGWLFITAIVNALLRGRRSPWQ